MDLRMFLLLAAAVHWCVSAAHATRCGGKRQEHSSIFFVVFRIFVSEEAAAARASADPHGGGVGVRLRRLQFAGKRLELRSGLRGRGGGRGHAGSPRSDWPVLVVRTGGSNAHSVALHL